MNSDRDNRADSNPDEGRVGWRAVYVSASTRRDDRGAGGAGLAVLPDVWPNRRGTDSRRRPAAREADGPLGGGEEMEIDGTRWLRVVLHALFMAAAASCMLAGIESRRMAIRGGRRATKIAPNTAPCSEPSPPTITSSRNWIDSRMVKMSGAR